MCCLAQDEFDRLLRLHTYPYSCQRLLSRACPAAQAAAAAVARQTASQRDPSSASSSHASSNCDHARAAAGSFSTGAAGCCCSCSLSSQPGRCTELSPELWLELSQVSIRKGLQEGAPDYTCSSIASQLCICIPGHARLSVAQHLRCWHCTAAAANTLL